MVPFHKDRFLITNLYVRQECSLGLDVSVSRRSYDIFSERLSLVELREGLGLSVI